MNYLDIELNYLELSFISGITKNKKKSTKECKEIFTKILGVEPKRSDLIKVKDLVDHFEVVRSFDKRFDKQSSLVVCLMTKSELYKNYLSDKAVLNRKTLTGSKSVLFKIMNNNQKENFIAIINNKSS